MKELDTNQNPDVMENNRDRADAEIEFPLCGKRKRQIVLTDRDREILRFCLEMKFASLSQIHRKFFSKLENGKMSHSKAWTRERIWLLKGHGFMAQQRISFNGAGYYLTTKLGKKAIEYASGNVTLPHPNPQIDIRTFYHDEAVIEARIELERQGRTLNWISERSMKANLESAFGLKGKYQPDGIYTNIEGKLIAFELEISLKSRSRYEEKVRKYLSILLQDKPYGLRAVLFVVKTDSVFQILTSLTKAYPLYFRVERLSSLMVSAASPPVDPTFNSLLFEEK